MKYLITEEDKKSLTDEEKKLLQFLMDKGLINSASQEKIQQLLGSAETAGEKDTGKKAETSQKKSNNTSKPDSSEGRSEASKWCSLKNDEITQKMKEKFSDSFINLQIKGGVYRMAWYNSDNGDKKALVFPPALKVPADMPNFSSLFNVDKQSKFYEIIKVPDFLSNRMEDPLRPPYVNKGEAKAIESLKENLIKEHFKRLKLLANIEK